ncbi:MAG: MOSC N-terminal beta barrel domain-containing protein [Bacteroidota bacterium]
MKNHVTGIYIYPVKSLAGISLESAYLCSTGLQYDRRWMLVDANHQFMTQRDEKRLCLFTPSIHPTHFTIRYEQDQVNIPHTLETGTTLIVKVWDNEVEAIKAPENLNQWFSNHLKKEVMLVYMPDTTHRGINPNHVIDNEQVGFADGYPVLMIGEASLQLLQSKVNEPIPMDRFRPNIVFSGEEAHEEDFWQYFTINDRTFRGIKQCKRCVVTTINQQTAIANAEPLKTLATYRKLDSHIMFGQNIAGPHAGIISVGDAITVIDYLPLPLPV